MLVLPAQSVLSAGPMTRSGAVEQWSSETGNAKEDCGWCRISCCCRPVQPRHLLRRHVRRPRLERVLVVAGELAPVGCYEGVHIREVAMPAQRRLCRGPAPRRCPTVDRAGRYSQRNWNVTMKIVQRRFGVTFVEVDEGSAACKKERSVSVTVGQPDGQQRKLFS